MYSSLRKIDIVTTAPDGRRLLIQTDHRSAREVEGEADLSVLFALTRILMPLASEHGRGATVRYAALEDQHARLAEVAKATGAELEVGGQIADLSAIARRAPAELADEAFAALGRAVLAREGLTADEAGLAALEASYAGAPSEEDDEIAYWTTVAELAAATGEALRAKAGGQWVDAPREFSGDIPFWFQAAGDSALSNPVGKVIKFLLNGEVDSPRHLLRSMEDRDVPEGPLLMNFKPAGWEMRDEVVCEPFVPLFGAGEADIPLVAYGHDRPNTFAMQMRGEGRAAGVDVAALRAEALANLAAIEVEVDDVDLDGVRLRVVQGSYYAGEKILDEAFMRRMHRELGAELIAAAVPEKGQLLLMNGTVVAAVVGLSNVARGAFENSGRPVSPTVFAVMDGKVVGVAKVEAPPKKRGFFSRLFN